MRKLFTLFLLTGLTYYPCAAQVFYTQGYIVTTANDTIRGELREVDNQLVKFRAGATAPERDYNPSQLSAYSTDGTTRIAGRITEQGKDTTLFMVEQIKGYTSLYRLIKPDGRLTHVLGLPDQTLLPLRGMLALNLLTTNLTECPAASFRQRLNPQLFYNSNLYYEQLITRYNDCVKPSANVKQKRKRLGYELGVLGGLSINSWQYGYNKLPSNVAWNPNGLYSTYYSYAVGGYYTTVASKKLSLTIEGLVSTYKGSREIRINDPFDPGNQARRTYFFNETYVTLPIIGRYTFAYKPVRVYAKAGLTLTRPLVLKGYYSGQGIIDVPIYTRNSLNIGYLAGIGVGIPISSSKMIYVESRFTSHVVMNGIANSRSLQLTVSVPILSR